MTLNDYYESESGKYYEPHMGMYSYEGDKMVHLSASFLADKLLTEDVSIEEFEQLWESWQDRAISSGHKEASDTEVRGAVWSFLQHAVGKEEMGKYVR